VYSDGSRSKFRGLSPLIPLVPPSFILLLQICRGDLGVVNWIFSCRGAQAPSAPPLDPS
jgi:hypothetical protein